MRDAKLEMIELLKEFRKYVDDCILLHELDTEAPPRPLSFDEWYVRIWQRNQAELQKIEQVLNDVRG
jgi:hypothetical protein